MQCNVLVCKMYINVHVCMYVYMFVCMYVCMYVYLMVMGNKYGMYETATRDSLANMHNPNPRGLHHITA